MAEAVSTSSCHAEEPPPAGGQAKKIFQFKISLLDYKPKIWRRIQVPSDFNFYLLHEAIQESMGWTDVHPHAFSMNGILIGPEKQYYHVDMGESVALIKHFFLEPNTKAIYEYDFVNRWEHKVRLEAIVPAINGQNYPRCVNGKKAGPLEDCGGTEGYKKLLKILADPSHPEHDERKEWTRMMKGIPVDGNIFDPDQFDPASVLTDWDAHVEHKRWVSEMIEAFDMVRL